MAALDFSDDEIGDLPAELTALALEYSLDPAANDTLELDGFGVDLWCLDDVDELGRTVTGPEGVGQALYRRFKTRRGGLLDDEDYGFDLQELLSKGMTREQLAAIPGQIRAECLKDERIESATVTTRLLAPETLEVTIRAVTGLGPFSLVLSASAAAIALVLLEAA